VNKGADTKKARFLVPAPLFSQHARTAGTTFFQFLLPNSCNWLCFSAEAPATCSSLRPST